MVNRSNSPHHNTISHHHNCNIKNISCIFIMVHYLISMLSCLSDATGAENLFHIVIVIKILPIIPPIQSSQWSSVPSSSPEQCSLLPWSSTFGTIASSLTRSMSLQQRKNWQALGIDARSVLIQDLEDGEVVDAGEADDQLVVSMSMVGGNSTKDNMHKKGHKCKMNKLQSKNLFLGSGWLP